MKYLLLFVLCISVAHAKYRYEGIKKSGSYEGAYKKFYKEVLVEEGQYKLGIKVGTWKTYNRKGNVSTTTKYGKYNQRIWEKRFYSSGKLKTKQTWTTNKIGRRTSNTIHYYENGQVRSKNSRGKGAKNSCKQVVKYPSGKIKSISKPGANGECSRKQFHKNGRLISHNITKNKLPVYKEEYYKRSQKKIKMNFKDGKPFNGIEWFESGKVAIEAKNGHIKYWSNPYRTGKYAIVTEVTASQWAKTKFKPSLRPRPKAKNGWVREANFLKHKFEVYYKKGRRVAERSSYKNGNKAYESWYASKGKKGIKKNWYENGALFYEVKVDNKGNERGKGRYYNKSGGPLDPVKVSEIEEAKAKKAKRVKTVSKVLEVPLRFLFAK